MRRAIRKHARDFAFVIGLVLVALLVGGYILSNQRFYLPKWVPVVGSDFVDYKAQFSTAQSVTPGQGQTVQVAGVDVGDITKVDLVDGRAVVTMKIRRKYTPIYKNATALLRPKTGLNDMVIELDPGTSTAGEAAEGLHRPGRPDTAQRQLRRDPVLAGHGHAQLPAAASRRRGRGARRPGQGAVGHAEALRADRALHRQAQRRAGRARAQHPPLDPQLPPALAGAGRQGRRPGGAGGLVQQRVQGVRRPGREPARVAAGAPGCPAGHEHHVGEGDRAGRRARADARRPAARRPRSRAGAGADAAVPQPDDADHPEPAAAVRSRGAAGGHGPAPGGQRPGGRHAQADHVGQGAQLPAQRAGLQPAGQGGGLPLLGVLGQPRRRRPSSPPRTRTGRSATAWSLASLLDAAGAPAAQRPGPAAGHAGRACSTRPTRRRCARRPARPARRRRSAARGGAARCRSRLPASVASWSWRASRCRASGCCSSCGSPSAARSRCSRRATASTWPSRRPARVAQEADVRISGVSVGKVKIIDADKKTGASDATIELDAAVRADPEGHAGDPAPEDAARRDLRRADARARKSAGTIPENGTLPAGAVSPTVELDEIFRAFDPKTRAAFQTWMQQLALRVGRPRARHLRRAGQPGAVRRGHQRRC